MHAKTLLLTALLMISGAHAAETATNGASFDNYFKNHFTLSYHGEYYFIRKDFTSDAAADRNIRHVQLMHNPTVTFKPTPNWQFLSTAEFKYSDIDPGGKDGTYQGGYWRSLHTITRKNILTEKEHGVKLDAGIGKRDFNTGHTAAASYGNLRAFTTISKTYGKHNGSLFIQYLYNEPMKGKVKATTWKQGVEIIPSITLQLTSKLQYLFTDDIVINKLRGPVDYDYQTSHEMNVGVLTYTFNDKLSTYYQLKYYHSDASMKDKQDDDWMENYAGLTFNATEKFSLTGEVGMELIHAHDGKSGFSKASRFPELALYVDYSF